MYADFGTVPFSATPTSRPSMPEKDPEPVHRHSPSRPTSESPCGRESPAPEEGEDNQRGRVEDNGRGGREGSRAAAAVKDGLQETSPKHAAEGERGGEQGDNRHGHHGVDDDGEGYHTPTSPRHRIPANLRCPPAPRKPPPERRRRKGRAGDKFYRAVWRRHQLPLEVELVLCQVLRDQEQQSVQHRWKRCLL